MPYVVYPEVEITSFAEALDLLEQKAPWFGELGVADVRTWLTGFPDFTSQTLVSLWSPPDSKGNGVVIQTASASQFVAKMAISPGDHHFPIEDLEGATVDKFGNTALKDCAHVYNIRLVPQYSLTDLTDAESTALSWALSFHEHSKSTNGLAKRDALKIRPRFIKEALDYPILRKRLDGFELQGLKLLTAFINDLRVADPLLPGVAVETLRVALQKAGLRAPKYKRQGPA